MQWLTAFFVCLFAVTALGVPLTSTDTQLAIPAHLRDQGDGFYVASFDDTGKANVAFTPEAEFLARHAIVAEDVAPKNNEALQKRKMSIWCEGGTSKKIYDVNWAIEQLGKNANDEYWPANHWGWVHNAHETAFFCPYRGWDGNSENIAVLNRKIDEQCGSRAKYGFVRHSARPGDKGVPDYSIGRTWRGNTICTNSFHPGSVKQAELDQGDGLYAAFFDGDNGKVNITFTPKNVLIARDYLSENPATKIIPGLQKRDGVECVDGESKSREDLDFANMALAKGAEGMRLDPNNWSWYHRNKETSYFCAYRAWHGSYQTVIEYHTTISKGCRSQTDYGYNHHAARFEADINLSVGRTWRGNHFCNKNFHPPPENVKSGTHIERATKIGTKNGSDGDKRDPPQLMSRPSDLHGPGNISGSTLSHCYWGPDWYGCSKNGYCWRECGSGVKQRGSWCGLAPDNKSSTFKRCTDKSECMRGGDCCARAKDPSCGCGC